MVNDASKIGSDFVGAASVYAFVVEQSSITVSDGAYLHATGQVSAAAAGVSLIPTYLQEASSVIVTAVYKIVDMALTSNSNAQVTAEGRVASALAITKQSLKHALSAYTFSDIRITGEDSNLRAQASDGLEVAVAAVAGVAIADEGLNSKGNQLFSAQGLTVQITRCVCTSTSGFANSQLNDISHGGAAASVGGIAIAGGVLDDAYSVFVETLSITVVDAQVTVSATHPFLNGTASASSFGVSFVCGNAASGGAVRMNGYSLSVGGTSKIETTARGYGSGAVSGGAVISSASLPSTTGCVMQSAQWTLLAQQTAQMSASSNNAAAVFGIAVSEFKGQGKSLVLEVADVVIEIQDQAALSCAASSVNDISLIGGDESVPVMLQPKLSAAAGFAFSNVVDPSKILSVEGFFAKLVDY